MTNSETLQALTIVTGFPIKIYIPNRPLSRNLSLLKLSSFDIRKVETTIAKKGTIHGSKNAFKLLKFITEMVKSVQSQFGKVKHFWVVIGKPFT